MLKAVGSAVVIQGIEATKSSATIITARYQNSGRMACSTLVLQIEQET